MSRLADYFVIVGYDHQKESKFVHGYVIYIIIILGNLQIKSYL